MYIKLTNGRKIIIKEKKYYEANINHFERNGFFPVGQEKKQTKKTVETTDKVVQLKPKKKKNVKKTKKKN